MPWLNRFSALVTFSVDVLPRFHVDVINWFVGTTQIRCTATFPRLQCLVRRGRQRHPRDRQADHRTGTVIPYPLRGPIPAAEDDHRDARQLETAERAS